MSLADFISSDFQWGGSTVYGQSHSESPIWILIYIPSTAFKLPVVARSLSSALHAMTETPRRLSINMERQKPIQRERKPPLCTNSPLSLSPVPCPETANRTAYRSLFLSAYTLWLLLVSSVVAFRCLGLKGGGGGGILSYSPLENSRVTGSPPTSQRKIDTVYMNDHIKRSISPYRYCKPEGK